MEPKLTKQSELILAKLQIEVDKKFFTPEEMVILRKGVLMANSVGLLYRLLLVGGAAAGAILAFLQLMPSGDK